MNSGSFFRLDLDISKVVSGVTVYDYIDVPVFDSEKDITSYPIRLTITSHEVVFFVHYFTCEEKPRHSEEVILRLPFKTKDEELLSSSIKRIYNTDFPLSDYLCDLLAVRYVQGWNDNKHDLQRKKYESLRDSQINKDSYSSLFIWDLTERQDNGAIKYQIQNAPHQQQFDVKPRITKFLRKLLLDFLFDLMHSDVFESSKYYSMMKDGLMNDFFFSAIIKKSEYYYYRRIIRNKLQSFADSEKGKDIRTLNKCVSELRKIEKKRQDSLSRARRKKYCSPQEINIINNKYDEVISSFISKNEDYSSAYDNIKSVKDLYAEKLDEAEAEWISIITGKLADKHFSFSPEWYEDQKPRKKRKGFNVSDSWFVNPEEEMARIVFPLRAEPEFRTKGEKLSVHYLNSYELGELVGTGDNSSVLERNTLISKWFYRRFDFVDTFRIHLFKNWNHVFAVFLLLFAVATMIHGFWDCPRNIALFPAVAAVGFFLTAVGFGFSLLRRKYARIDDVLVQIRHRRELMKSFRLSVLFGALWAFLYFYQFPDSPYWQYLAIKVFGFLGIGALTLYSKPRVHIIDNIHLFLPRLVASITTAWIMIVIGNDLVKEHLSWPIWVILSAVVFAFILYENNKALPNITTGHKVWRALELMLISFSISLVIGIFAVDILSPSLVTDYADYKTSAEDVLVKIPWQFLHDNEELTINIFPDYLIQFSFLAMFIGVFIQMIFEEKSITEM